MSRELYHTDCRILQVYFRHVYSPNPEVVEVAHQGLRDVLTTQSKLPKDLLQNGLRPILVNLADAKRLSVSGLDGLARFLELLTTYFKVEIGSKLLDHFETLGDAQMLANAAKQPLDSNPDIARMSRLINIFRLLPQSAVQFLNRLTAIVVAAETGLHQTVPGPFTEPLAKFLDRYHVEGAQLLLDNLSKPRHVWTYRNVIQSGFAPQLLEVLSSRATEICQTCFADLDHFETVMTGLSFIRELSKTSDSWLTDQQPVLESLVSVWRSILQKARDPAIDMSDLFYQEAPQLLLEMFMACLSHSRIVQLLFHVVEAFEIRSAFERSPVAFFLYEQGALQESLDYRRELLEHFLNLYDSDHVTTDFKTNALRYVINPVLSQHYSRPDADDTLVSSELVGKIEQLVWRPIVTSTGGLSTRKDTQIIELFVMTTLLIRHCHPQVSEYRKDVFRMAWMGIALVEPTVKLMSYILVSTFMAKFESPTKFVRLIWTGLLRLKEHEQRALFRQALDTLASTIPKIDPPQPGVGIAEWAGRVRSILVEEGQSTSQLTAVCELLVGHPDLFYDYRELYVPHIANSLNKLGFVQASSPESKKLSVDVVELIYRWEKKRQAVRDSEAMDVEEAAKKTKAGSPEPSPKRQRLDRGGTAASVSSGGGWATPSQVRELITSHLLRLVASSSDPASRTPLIKRALELFKEILSPQGLPSVSVKISFFQRTMLQVGGLFDGVADGSGFQR